MYLWSLYRRLMVRPHGIQTIEESRTVDINQAAQEYLAAVQSQNAAVEKRRQDLATIASAQAALDQAQVAAVQSAQEYANAQQASADALAHLEAAALQGVVPESL